MSLIRKPFNPNVNMLRWYPIPLLGNAKIWKLAKQNFKYKMAQFVVQTEVYKRARLFF